MSCNRCARVSQLAAAAVGAPAVEPAWAAGRGASGHCPTCGGWLRADGGCRACGGEAGPALGDTVVTAPSVERRLSCGHTMVTDARPGDEEWCAGCDEMVLVEAEPAGVEEVGGRARIEEYERGLPPHFMRMVPSHGEGAEEIIHERPVAGTDLAVRIRSGINVRTGELLREEGDKIAVVIARQGGEGRSVGSAYRSLRRGPDWPAQLGEVIAEMEEKARGGQVERCPRCGAYMRVRWSRGGGSRFLGCSNYPDCRETQSLPGGGSGRAGGKRRGSSSKRAAPSGGKAGRRPPRPATKEVRALGEKLPAGFSLATRSAYERAVDGSDLVIRARLHGDEGACIIQAYSPGLGRYVGRRHVASLSGMEPQEQVAALAGHIGAGRIEKCPRCGSYMVEREATRGKHKGERFLGCVSYPGCRETKPL